VQRTRECRTRQQRTCSRAFIGYVLAWRRTRHADRAQHFGSSSAAAVRPVSPVVWRSAFGAPTIRLRSPGAASRTADLTIHSRGTPLFAIFKQAFGGRPLNSGIRRKL